MRQVSRGGLSCPKKYAEVSGLTGRERYRSIVDHYEACLEKHGDSHLGVDWPNPKDAWTRYQVMLDVIKEPAPIQSRLLDFGCGASHLYEFVLNNRLNHIRYSGLDISGKFVALSRRKYPANTYYCVDILKSISSLPRFDYVVMNGVFTEKRDLTFDEMFSYFSRMVEAIFTVVDRGIAFNMMSKHVDWERDDLFHLPFDTLASFLCKRVTRNFTFRSDYGLYEYTTYVYR